MAIDFSKANPDSDVARPIDPIEIFQSCKVSDKSINDLWLAQGDALREYHRHRADPDINIALNTGAGKTLVGLLIAQSLVNELSRQVVYACASIQLIDQTREKAAGYGLDVTTYYGGNFSNKGYATFETPCLTTYQALFNGKTIFRHDDIGAVIFDDAHTSDQILRDQFTLSIDRESLKEVYNELSSLFVDYHNKIGQSVSYREMLNGDPNRIFLIPPYVVYENMHKINKILLSARLSERNDTKFEWGHLRDFTDRCCILVSSRSITLTPPFIPVKTLPYFSTGVRRVYLSATLDAPDSFARSFGRVPTRRIAPSTKAGECERLVIVPSMSDAISSECQVIAKTASFLDGHKALIIVPTYDLAEHWVDVADLPDKASVAERVRQFRHADAVTGLILVGRYDGIDLPGSTCRVLVIDGLPKGSGPLERYLWTYMKMHNTLRNSIVCRLVQAFGRISRGMSDYGVVVLSGDDLVNWIRIRENVKLLPNFLARQIRLGLELSRQIDDEIEELADYCFNRDVNWIEKHEEDVSGVGKGEGAEDRSAELDSMVTVALAECRYIEFLWDSEFEKAAKALSDVSKDAARVSDNLKAWHAVWLGYALERAGDRKGARSQYRSAHAIQRNVPRFQPREDLPSETPRQVQQVADQMEEVGINVDLPRGFESNLAALGHGSSSQVEASLRYLGQYLGFQSLRPDKEHRTGPDVLWIMEDLRVAVCIEAKSDKGEGKEYTKRDVGQMHDHVQWVHTNYKTIEEVVPVFVGPKQGATDSANPSDETLVAEVQNFADMGVKLASVLRDVANTALPISLVRDVEKAMRSAGLLGRDVLRTLGLVRIRGGRP